MPHLNLTVDEALATTRAVRRRLDLARPVERSVIEECISLAQQAPNGGNFQVMHFVAVTDPEQRLALGEIYRAGLRLILGEGESFQSHYGDRMGASVEYLFDHIHEAPLLLVPCRELAAPRAELTPFRWANHYGDAHMATWSFMLAARERGLGTAMTTVHLLHEQEAAEVLGIDYEHVAQTALLPVAYTLGTDFRPVARKPIEEILHWDRW
jgi:nitroreductase